MAMLRVLVELGSRPVVLHVDHGLRGEESREDARFVRDLCGRVEVPCEVRSAKIGEGNVQEEARRERYALAEAVMDECGLEVIATAHTADDVAETVLLNLARGSGLRGLAGIPPIRGRVVRPLIENRRTEVIAYLSLLGQPYRTDSTNLTPKYARNRVRLEVLPVLEELYSGATGNMARSAALLRHDLEALEGVAANVVLRRGQEVFVPLEKLSSLHTALQRLAVRHAYSGLLLNAPPLDSAHVEAVLELSRRAEGQRRLDLPGDATVARGPQEIVFYRREMPLLGEIDLRVGVQEFADWFVVVREVPEFDPEDAARLEVAYFDASKGPFRVRMAREGDTIRPLGLGGEKKVMRAMMDRKVPKDLRRRTPVVVDGSEKVAWVFMGELGEEFKVRPATEKLLRVEVERIQ